jgi:hypothetical protein
MTAGPLLTLVIYKPGKWGLGFDLKVIALVQAAFLAYGLHTLWLARPVFLVGTDVRFTLVSASDIDEADLAKASRPEWRKLPWTGPYLVGVLPPADQQSKNALLDTFMTTGKDQEQLPTEYVGYDRVAGLIKANARSASDTPAALKTATIGLPIYSRDDEGWMQIDAQSGRPVAVRR